jgi:glycosyltransferase involved in cell wall biosynthesis
MLTVGREIPVARIVIDARSIVAKKSGIGNYTEALIRALVPLAPDLQFLLLRHPHATSPIVDSERVEQLVFPGETKSTRTVFSLGLKHRFADCDLYHSPADLIPLGLRCPWVVTVHDLMWIEAPRLASAFAPVRLANGLWYGANIGRAVRGARRLIAISSATAEAISRVYPAHADKTRVVHHGIDHARYSAERAGPRSLLDRWVPPNDRYSLIVGQGSPYKNHPGMLRAFVEATRDDPRHKLVLVRRFSRIDREMKRLLSRPEIARKLVCIPFVEDHELLTLYRHAHLLLFVSHYEGFGLPALEAMCLGTPVLASTAQAVREITAEGALHADPASHADMVEKIAMLDRDPALRARLIEAGRRRALEFSWQRCAEQTLAVYREALAAGRR